MFFGVAAIVPLGSWFILLFSAPPESVSALEAAARQLRFVFSSESPAPWWFAGWAALPFALAGLSCCSLSPAFRRKPIALAAFLASLVLAAVSLLFYWPLVAALVAGGSLNAFRSYRSAT